jgi:hypothetical protein
MVADEVVIQGPNISEASWQPPCAAIWDGRDCRWGQEGDPGAHLLRKIRKKEITRVSQPRDTLVKGNGMLKVRFFLNEPNGKP